MRVASTLFVILTSFALVGCAGDSPALCENLASGRLVDATAMRSSPINSPANKSPITHYRYYENGAPKDIRPSDKNEWECRTTDLWAKDTKPVDN